MEVRGCCQWLGGGIWSSALLPSRRGTGKGAVGQCGGRGESSDLSGNGFAPGKGKGGAGVSVGPAHSLQPQRPGAPRTDRTASSEGGLGCAKMCRNRPYIDRKPKYFWGWGYSGR